MTSVTLKKESFNWYNNDDSLTITQTMTKTVSGRIIALNLTSSTYSGICIWFIGIGYFTSTMNQNNDFTATTSKSLDIGDHEVSVTSNYTGFTVKDRIFPSGSYTVTAYYI